MFLVFTFLITFYSWANKDSHFSYGSCGAMTDLASKGAPIKSIGVIDAMGTEAILVRPDSGVKTIKDLKGKKILTTANAGVNTFFPIVLANAGLKESDVNITNVPDGALVSSYLISELLFKVCCFRF